jgi:phosphoribosyl 1,2-cyclic phosphodiesterase
VSLRVRVIASGSGGNAALYSAGGTHVLLDCGVSARRLACALREEGVEPEDLSGVFITHEHGDHVQGLRVFLKKRRIPLFIAPESWASPSCFGVEPWAVEPLRGGSTVRVGPMCLTPFPLPHDSAACFGFVVEAGGVKAVQATDLGTPTALVRERLRGAHCVLLEFNHDPDLLMRGSYPLDVKIRVRGRLGHLSNQQAGGLLEGCAHGDLRAVFLMHLSKENNLPQMALLSAREALGGREVPLAVAPQDSPAPAWEG